MEDNTFLLLQMSGLHANERWSKPDTKIIADERFCVRISFLLLQMSGLHANERWLKPDTKATAGRGAPRTNIFPPPPVGFVGRVSCGCEPNIKNKADNPPQKDTANQTIKGGGVMRKSASSFDRASDSSRCLMPGFFSA